MANHDNLPIWARILLGIPDSDAEPDNGGEVDREGGASERRSEIREAGPYPQDIGMFQRAADHDKRGWQVWLRPVRGEFQL